MRITDTDKRIIKYIPLQQGLRHKEKQYLLK